MSTAGSGKMLACERSPKASYSHACMRGKTRQRMKFSQLKEHRVISCPTQAGGRG
jgi:hypothetical protein